MSYYVAAYDISHPGHREHVAGILLRYGLRVQRSVYEIWLEPADVLDLQRAVGAYLGRDDAFDLFPIDRRDPARRIRWMRPPPGRDPVVLL